MVWMSLTPLPKPACCIASSSHFHIVGISVLETVLDMKLRLDDCCLSQNPRAWTSSWASGALFAPLFSSSPVISWRTGSVSTSVQTMRNISASKSLISLCLWMISPPCLQTIAWSTVNKSPHMHMAGRSAISQSYLVWLHLWILFCLS